MAEAVTKASARTRAKRSTGITVMGVTIPRSLRNAFNRLINSPVGREILASALLAAASAAAAALLESSNKAKAAKAREAGSEAGDRMTEAAAGVVAGVISGAASSLLALPGAGEKKRNAG